MPTATLATSGVLTADPLALMEAERKKWKKVWNATESAPAEDYSFANRSRLVAVTPAEIRRAALSFSETTATTVDGFHPRHYALLSECS